MQLEWNAQVAQMMSSLGTADFGHHMSNALKSLVEFDFTVIFGYVGTAQPLALYNDFPEDRRRLHVDEYLEGPYLLDPFFLASTGDVEPGLWRLSEIAPDRFYQGEYFRSYYGQTGLAEEIGYLVQVNDSFSIVVSLMRRTRRFSKAEMKLLKTAWPIIDVASRQHWEQATREGTKGQSTFEGKIEMAFRRIGEGVLTPREREVVELTLRGHSADAVGKLLGISSGTVRIHRKNIYSKLRINSQGELFSAFLSAIADTPSTAGLH